MWDLSIIDSLIQHSVKQKHIEKAESKMHTIHKINIKSHKNIKAS